MKKYEKASIDIIYAVQNVLSESFDNDAYFGKGYFLEDLD